MTEFDEIIGDLLKGKIIEWNSILIRLVTASDANVILALRQEEDKKNRHFINPVSGGINEQKAWIEDYKKREALGRELYLMSTDKSGQKCWSVIRVILEDGYFTVGSWVSDKDAEFKNSIYLELFAKSIGFQAKGYENCLFEIRKNNSKVIRYHKMFGAFQIDEKDENLIFNLSRIVFEEKRNLFIS